MTEYQCVRTLRNGAACRGQRLNWRIGPQLLTLCNRHLRQYNEDRATKLTRVLRDHENGLHGEGEERKQFAENYESGEFYLHCGLCKDELESEDLAVKPHQVAEAKALRTLMDRAFLEEQGAKERFLIRFKDNPLGALEQANGYIEILYKALLYRRISRKSEGGGINMVDAYNLVIEEVKKDLLNGMIEGPQLQVAARFVRKSYW